MEGDIEMDTFGAAKDADIGGDEYNEDDYIGDLFKRRRNRFL